VVVVGGNVLAVVVVGWTMDGRGVAEDDESPSARSTPAPASVAATGIASSHRLRRTLPRYPGAAPASLRGALRAVDEGRPEVHTHRVAESSQRRRRVFVEDARANGLFLRTTWHPEGRQFVVSTWNGEVCTGAVRVPVEGAAELISLLADGLADAAETRSEHLTA
jgi:hypothetical protein